MKLFKPKHISIEELRKDTGRFFIFFTIISVIGIALVFFFPVYSSFIILIMIIVFAAFTIIMFQILFHRINVEMQCKIAGKNFMDYCTCKACRIRRGEEKKGQTTL